MINRIINIVFNTLVIFMLLLLSQKESYAQTYSKRPSWKQEFSSLWKKPLRGWNQTLRYAPSGTAFFTDSIGNVFVKNGCLHLKATAEKRGDKVCSSGYVTTKDLQSFLYGKLEIRAKAPTGKGIFPAIWLLREDLDYVWPRGEIDIMEYIECFEQKEFATTIHLLYREDSKSPQKKHVHSTQCEADMTKFHIFGLEWTPNELTFTLDRKPYYSLSKEEAEYWPFDVPYILILDVGYGSWGAQCGTDESIFPQEMLVDWIRYYPLVEN